jgi:hypothetical protein
MRITITGTLEETTQKGTTYLRWRVRETDGRLTEVAIPTWAISQFSGVRVGRTVQITGIEQSQPGGWMLVRASDIDVIQ